MGSNLQRQAARQLTGLQATMDGRVELTVELLLAKAREAGYWLSADGRIGEADLAALLGLTPNSLANKRREGTAPPSFSLGGGGHKITYRLTDAAHWLESHRVNSSC